MYGNVPGAEWHQAPVDPLDGSLPSDAGHGTFICGIIRQVCPSARLLAIPVMAEDGVVAESGLMATLLVLLHRHIDGVVHGNPDLVIDVLNLSLGYYHENADDIAFDGPFASLLADFGAWGVAVVASAGNSGTTRPMYPAAFAAAPDEPGRVPQVTVGALNADGTSVAYFSNAGAWVTAHRIGASLVSTVPTTLSGDAQPAAGLMYQGLHRTTPDPDAYASGFATWSGTSFAGPVLAGEIARALVSDPDLTTIDRGACVARGRRAITTVHGRAT
jgi:subtilisin family serine protease